LLDTNIVIASFEGDDTVLSDLDRDRRRGENITNWSL